MKMSYCPQKQKIDEHHLRPSKWWTHPEWLPSPFQEKNKMIEEFLSTLNRISSRIKAFVSVLQRQSNREMFLRAREHENVTLPTKTKDWRAPSPPVKVMDKSAVSSISISPTKEMNEVFLPTLNLKRSRMVASICGIQSPYLIPHKVRYEVKVKVCTS